MAKENHPVVLFDGVCNLCDHAVQFIIRHDRHRKLRFASLQSGYAAGRLETTNLPPTYLDSFVLLEAGRCYTRSTAALRVARYFGGLWQLLYVFILIPRPIRDAVYNLVGRYRYRWFGKKNSCMVPTPELKVLFLD